MMDVLLNACLNYKKVSLALEIRKSKLPDPFRCFLTLAGEKVVLKKEIVFKIEVSGAAILLKSWVKRL